jgi:protein gp37
MHPDWARDLRDWFDDYAVPFFFKQWGEGRAVRSIDDQGWYGPTDRR